MPARNAIGPSVAGALLAVAMPAAALAAPAARGGLVFTPAASIDTAAIKVHTSAGCPQPADGYYAVAHGHGFPPAGLMVTAPTAAGLSLVTGFDVYFAQTMKDFATDNHTVLSGRYAVSVFCVDSFTGTKFAEFTGALTFTTPTAYRASGAPAAAPPVTTAAAPALTAAAPVATGQAAAGPVVAGPVAAGPDRTGGASPAGWIGAAVAAVLLAFEAGRRVGRRTRKPHLSPR